MARRQTYPTVIGRLRLYFNEDEVARFTAVSFGLLAWTMLCLAAIDHL
jgi:hypothetical protein